MEIVKEIREKIKEYREAILLESTLISLKSPSRRAWKAFQNTFHNADSKNRTQLWGGTGDFI
jgi:hypothetical protein